MNDSTTNYSLVLIGRYPGKDMGVAQALARCMGRDESWGLRIVSSSPIVFFEKLSEKNARQIGLALAEVAKAGCKFEVQQGIQAALPKVGWATPPRINGLTLAEIAPGSDNHIAAVPPPVSSATPLALPSIAPSQPAAASTQASAALEIPCPYTGQKIKLFFTVTLTRADGATALHVTASAATPIDSLGEKERAAKRSASGISGTVIPPLSANPRQTASHGQLKYSGPQMRPASQEMNIPLGSAQQGSSSLNSLAPARAKTAANKIPALLAEEPSPSWRRNTPAEFPLPDVPVIPSAGNFQPRAPRTEHQPLPLDSQPMDLSTFEASLGTESRQNAGHMLDEAEVFSSPADLDPDDDLGDDAESEQILCSVFIARSSSPVVHELVAEFHGISESEASEMCVAGNIPLAENIPLFEAKDIKRRCAAINVFARIVRQDDPAG